MTDNLGQRKTGEELTKFLEERALLHPDLTEVQLQVGYALGFGDSPEDVAKQFGVTRNELAQWRSFLPFADFEAQVNATSRRFRKGDFSNKDSQVEILSDYAQRICDVMDARSGKFRNLDNGAATGLLTKTEGYTRCGKDDYIETVEWHFDVKLGMELRATLRDIGTLRGFGDKGKLSKRVQERPTMIGVVAVEDADRLFNGSTSSSSAP